MYALLLENGRETKLPIGIFDLNTTNIDCNTVDKVLKENFQHFALSHGSEDGLIGDINSSDHCILERMDQEYRLPIVQKFLETPVSEIQGATSTKELVNFMWSATTKPWFIRDVDDTTRNQIYSEVRNFYFVGSGSVPIQVCGHVLAGENIRNLFRYLMLSISPDITQVSELSTELRTFIAPFLQEYSLTRFHLPSAQEEHLTFWNLFRVKRVQDFLGTDITNFLITTSVSEPIVDTVETVGGGVREITVSQETIDMSNKEAAVVAESIQENPTPDVTADEGKIAVTGCEQKNQTPSKDDSDGEPDKKDSWAKKFLKKIGNYACKANYGLPFQTTGFVVVLGVGLAVGLATGKIGIAMLVGSNGTKLLSEVLAENNADSVGASTWSPIKETITTCFANFKQWLSK